MLHVMGIFSLHVYENSVIDALNLAYINLKVFFLYIEGN